jgi:hypothetical protein
MRTSAALTDLKILVLSSSGHWNFNVAQFSKIDCVPARMMSRVESKEMNGLNGLTGLGPAEGEHNKQNAWAGPGPAAFDFRSE